jgi:hypothetical protein
MNYRVLQRLAIEDVVRRGSVARRRDKSAIGYPRRDLRASVKPEFAQNVLDVVCGRARADHKLFGDAAISQPARHQHRDLELPPGKRSGLRCDTCWLRTWQTRGPHEPVAFGPHMVDNLGAFVVDVGRKSLIAEGACNFGQGCSVRASSSVAC